MPLVLVINAGSSSVKFGLYREDTDQEEELARGAVEGIGPGRGEFWAGESHRRVRTFIDHGQAIAEILHYLEMQKLADRVAAVGHRVVHGGADYTESTLINNQVLDDLRTLVPFAPLHLPPEIAAVEAVSHVWPTLPQVACFDTAFHRTMPQHAQRYPLPEWVWEEGVQHYGFHGLSYTYIVETLGEMAKGKTVIAHLGNGASMAAVLDGECRDTTMGFTPTGGLVMGSRSGDLDPGIFR